MYAVVDDRNQQYRVQPGDRIQIHLCRGVAEGETLTFDKVCLVGGEGAGRIGTPFVNGASVVAKVVRQVKGPKVITGKFRRRKNSRRRRGFRAQYTVVQIESIQG
ncbi:MAG: 50S ribosomal protein L21 [Planctomycetes bacterium]|nr:50S ribosomal protein L21 [Planctomycetota bacterium]MBZ0151038.1 50S ribosomal protein L21 [Planctomycetota bacterium]MCC7399191.1 50S ribosomal protein L21 [Planctomycetota bacterium]